ncbi:MAG: DUF3298 domain-containing protein [Bacteroidetes bacterium]|nr:DUF3298 domain-containing protein [Bacteroidota bacterium]
MKKIVYITLVLFSVSLAACTRESSKTTDTKTTPSTTDKKQEDVKNNTTSTDKKTSESGQNSSNEAAGNNGSDLPKFTQKVFTKNYKNCIDTAEGCTYIQVYYPEMTDGKYKDKVNALVKDMALSCYSTDDVHYADFDKLISQFMKDYEDFRKDVPDFPGGWTLKDSTSIVTNTTDILCLQNTSESYLGGAHGAYNVAYTNFDMRNGNILKTKDIFIKGYEKTLNKLIEERIRKHFEMKPNENLVEGGLFENKVSFNDNFAIKKDGIEFLYNQYEIAPYAMGVIEIKLSYKDLDAILNKDVIKF